MLVNNLHFVTFDARCFYFRVPLPAPFNTTLDSFQKLIVLKCLRPDKVTNAMQDFLTEKIGARFVEPQTTDLSAMYKESSAVCPLIFVLSTGTDPAASLYKFAEKMKFTKRMFSISLGQGQGPRAEALIEEGIDAGNWVFFQVSPIPFQSRYVQHILKSSSGYLLN